MESSLPSYTEMTSTYISFYINTVLYVHTDCACSRWLGLFWEQSDFSEAICKRSLVPCRFIFSTELAKSQSEESEMHSEH